jgi:ribonuclease HII
LIEEINNSNVEYFIGVDECGTGSLAGEVFVCAFLAKKDWTMFGVCDSKKIAEKKREKLCDELMQNNIFSIVSSHPNDIDNLHQLLKFLYWNAVNNVLNQFRPNSYLIVLDGIIKFPKQPYSLGNSISLPKADALVPVVSAASIIGKVNRDRYIIELENKYPNYNWKNNKGYPTKEHKAAIDKFGICDEHRKNYEPIKSLVKK